MVYLDSLSWKRTKLLYPHMLLVNISLVSHTFSIVIHTYNNLTQGP